jgi:hypothetical protein
LTSSLQLIRLDFLPTHRSMAKWILDYGANNSRAFDSLKGDSVQLIEVSGSEELRQTTVTEDLIDRYITHDFPNKRGGPQVETLKLL